LILNCLAGGLEQAIQKILREFGYQQPRFENIQYEWYKKAEFDQCLDVNCTTHDWCLEDGQEQYVYHDFVTVLGRIEEDVPEGGRGLHYPYSNEIVMMHAWIPLEAFKALIERMIGVTSIPISRTVLWT
jgi:hypothetical protein